MFGSRLAEFFEGESGLLSLPRLTMFLSFWPASYIVIKNPTETMLGLYLGAYVLGYISGKGIDAAVAPKQQKTSIMDVSSISADISVTANQPLAGKSKPAGRGKARAF